jgi:hypothetical protein
VKQNNIHMLVEDWHQNGLLPPSVAAKVASGAIISASPRPTFPELLQKLQFFEGINYQRYVPALYSKFPIPYFERLIDWLENVGLDANDKKLLFEFATQLLYFSFEDFLAMYRYAFVAPITHWIVQLEKLTLNNPKFEELVENERKKHTWYCPITDSMIISEFYHVNHITGIDQRPGFRALKELFSASSDIDNLKKYIQKQGYKRLVLLEDFVGSGTQSVEVIMWAAEHLDVPILFSPMVICPDGLNRFNAERLQFIGKFPKKIAPKIEVTILLEKEDFVSGNAKLKDVEVLAKKIHDNVKGTANDKTYGHLGFFRSGDKSTGSRIILFSNTPDNSLPILHYHGPDTEWKPLFPRIRREVV